MVVAYVTRFDWERVRASEEKNLFDATFICILTSLIHSFIRSVRLLKGFRCRQLNPSSSQSHRVMSSYVNTNAHLHKYHEAKCVSVRVCVFCASTLPQNDKSFTFTLPFNTSDDELIVR